ncbi:MAG: glutamate-1-semialdehyde 2,1-aminomutase, partial [Bacteroidota bacterium]
GSHTYAKGDDQYPEFCPPYLVKGKGCRVWDLDGNEFIEYGMGLRAVSLGHAYDPITWAACQQMNLGSNFARPATIEYEAAKAFLEMVPEAEMVKFAKNGSDATTAAIKLARAYTGKKKVAICGNHPFFSIDDWFIGTTAVNAGIPCEVTQMTVKFEYNNIESVIQLFDTYSDEIACFIMEPEKYDSLDMDFYNQLKQLCRERNTLLILDEMITGFRWHNGGAQTLYNLDPDLSTFGKAMGNGFSIAALAGRKEIMELGGIYHNKERVFLLSTTHGAEHHSLAAMMAVIEIYQENDVIGHLKTQGERLRNGLLRLIEENNLKGYVGIHGHPSCLVFSTRDQMKQPSQPYRTLLLQELVKRGVIAPNIVISYSHQEKDIDQTIAIFSEALKVYRKALDEGVGKYLVGRAVQPVYRKWNHKQYSLS